MKKIIALSFLLMFLLNSCSRLDLAVNLANSYVANKADDYFDLSRAQAKWLKGALERNITKVKKTIFPQLAAEMFKAADILSDQRTLDASLILTTYNRLEGLMYDGLRIFAVDAVAFANTLSPNQIHNFQKEFDKKLNELKEDPEKKSYERIKKQFDSWMGGMSSDQKKELHLFVQKNPAPIKESIYNRQLIAHNFIRSYPDKNARKLYVEKLFTQYESMREPNYKKIAEDKTKRVAGFVTSIFNRMSEDQRKTLIETIRDRANQLIKISKG